MPTFPDVEAWLKNTIPGLIVLGAMGSIVTVWLFRLSKYPVQLIHHGRHKFSLREHDKGFVAGVIVSYTHERGDAVAALSWYALKLFRFLTAITLLIIALLSATVLVSVSEPRILTLGSFASVVIVFLAVRWMYEEFRDVRSAFNHLLLPTIEEAKGKDEAERKQTG